MRNRIEDLGRIYELLIQIDNSGIIADIYENCQGLFADEENEAETIRQMRSDLRQMQQNIIKALDIASGSDTLNGMS